MGLRARVRDRIERGAFRLRPNVVHTNIVRNQSSRNGVSPDLIVIHTTEGHNIPNSARDLIGLGNFFDRAEVEASSHVGNDEDGQSARYVRDERKAWTQGFQNPRSLSIEQVGFASKTREMWKRQARKQFYETARWVAHWSLIYHIPIRNSRGASRSGVAGHRDLPGATHTDPGSGFPMRLLIVVARLIKAARIAARRK